MIVGTGIDVVDVARFERTLLRTPALRVRLFTPLERPLHVRSLAARFAAKEALAKALGAPAGMSWQHCEVRRDRDGRPELHITETVALVAARKHVTHLHLSLSHDGGVATAFVVAECLAER
ncbi:holo-ACP synthase [Kribbia dieselivorans]|uniref:holo-ACP synthase n=1 Tax=Kribbia dieselivorans TaxID=331526 RepID=UPI0008392EF1|nr:holo-ACP synthase [Kribbia dieselivorans]